MNNINKVSEITVSDLIDYLRISELTNDDRNTLSTLLTVAKSYAVQYTGRTLDELDDFSDVVIVVLIIVQDMWDNRTLYVGKYS